jgi:hypothetical protein
LTFDFGLGACKLALRSRDDGARSLEFDPMVRRVDPKQRFVDREESTGHQPGRNPDHFARNLRDEIALGARNHRTLRLHRKLHLARLHFDHGNERRIREGRARLDTGLGRFDDDHDERGRCDDRQRCECFHSGIHLATPGVLLTARSPATT